jgi:serine/threonine protein kinase
MKSRESISVVESNEKIEEIEALIDAVFEHPEKENLGCGNAACVFTTPDHAFCIKREKEIIEEGKRPLNSIDKEMEYQADASALGARAPMPIRSYVSDENRSYLLMEVIEGHSLEQIIAKNISLPENYNHEEFWQELRQMLDKMHQGRLYHRDLHEGNVMIDFKTGKPAVIDFGMAGYSFFEEEDPYVKTNFWGPGNDLYLLDDNREYERMKKKFSDRSLTR